MFEHAKAESCVDTGKAVEEKSVMRRSMKIRFESTKSFFKIALQHKIYIIIL